MDNAGQNVTIRPYREEDVESMCVIWNEVVEAADAFPQFDQLAADDAPGFFSAQTHCAVAIDDATEKVLGLYILHPNNIGRVGHICNTSYAVSSTARGRHIGRKLVLDSLEQGAACGFRILQFNAVVATNAPALHLYESLGFTRLGTVPGGFLMDDGSYENIVLMFHELV